MSSAWLSCFLYWTMQGSWIMRQSVGSTPCLLGKAVECNYIRGPKYLEVSTTQICNCRIAWTTHQHRLNWFYASVGRCWYWFFRCCFWSSVACNGHKSNIGVWHGFPSTGVSCRRLYFIEPSRLFIWPGRLPTEITDIAFILMSKLQGLRGQSLYDHFLGLVCYVVIKKNSLGCSLF